MFFTHIRRNRNDIQLSKSLSWILRHGAVKEHLPISSEGYVAVNTLLTHRSLRGKWNQSDIERVVNSNDKQRFKLRTNPETGILEIKANQGHTITEILEIGLFPILEPIYITAVHGTYFRYWPSIQKQGLSRMKRNHIHLAKGTLGDSTVISGLRENAELYIFIDLARALEDGIKFYESENGVILTPGNKDGFLEPKYFSKVSNISTGMFSV